MDQNQNINHLSFYRRRMQYSQKQVASLLDLPHSATVSRYEQGHVLPPLSTALQLGAIYRTPVDSLFEGLYGRLRMEIRMKEATMRGSAQQGLLF